MIKVRRKLYVVSALMLPSFSLYPADPTAPLGFAPAAPRIQQARPTTRAVPLKLEAVLCGKESKCFAFFNLKDSKCGFLLKLKLRVN